MCSLKTAYLFVQNTPNVDKVIVSLSPKNEMHFILEKFLEDPCGNGSVPKCEIVWDDWNPGDWESRWAAWDKWRAERNIDGRPFDVYKELYLRIHGCQRQHVLCGSERGLGRRNIYQYWWCGQEGNPDELLPEVDWFGDGLIDHPARTAERDVYISPHAKTQGNYVFTFDFWSDVVHRLVDAGVAVTVGYDGWFCEDLVGHPCYRKHWGDHRAWMAEVCRHKLVACGNTGTGWLAAACGVPMVTMEPPNSVMADHRYRECGLRNIVELFSEPDAARVARRIEEEVRRCVVMTTGCYDVLHAGHVRHLERARAMGTKLVVAMNSDLSVKALKGPERPINPQDQRRAVLEALRCVDEVRVFDGPNAVPLIAELKPDVLACGYGYKPQTVVGRELVERYGGRVAITCQGDARDEPSTTKVVKRIRSAEIAEIVRAGAAYSVNPPDKLMLMAREFLSVKHLPGDVADLGSCRGGTALILRRLAADKHLHLFDTWAGTPYNDPLCDHKAGEWSASLDECMKLVGKDAATHYWDGVFPETTFGLSEVARFCFAYVDADTERATHDAIVFFWPRLAPGGKMVFDDYGWGPCAGVKVAVDEAFPDGGPVEKSINQALYTCVVEKR